MGKYAAEREHLLASHTLSSSAEMEKVW